MKKLLLFILVVAVVIVVARQMGYLGGSSKAKEPDFTKPQSAAEYFFDAAMAGNEAKLRRVCADDREETLLKSARNLRSAIPADKRGDSFRWQNTSTEMGEDQAYTGKIGTTLFFIGLRRAGTEYEVCRVMVGG